jgi:lipid II:glycine glycyltransferase (peptidoglycan interpeptide bridge formation enzyme)
MLTSQARKTDFRETPLPHPPQSAFVAEIDRVSEAEWTSLVQKFDDATIYQMWPYVDVRWHSHRASRLVVRDGARVVAASQVCVMQAPAVKAGIAYLSKGPMWRLRGETPDPEVLRATLRALRAEYVEKRRLLLRIVPNEIDDEANPARAILEQEGFERIPWAKAYRTFLLDVSPTMDELYKGLRHDWRTHLNRAHERPFEAVCGTSDDLYAQFTDLYRQMHARKGFLRFVDVDQFWELQRRLPQELKMRIIVVSLEGVPMTASVVAPLGNTALGIFLATGTDALKIQGANQLVWEQIIAMKRMGLRYVDLGGIDPEENPGGYRFKRGLSGKDTSHIGEYQACENPVSRLLVNSAQYARHSYRRIRVRINLLTHPVKFAASKNTAAKKR